MFALLLDSQTWASLFTLTVLEIVLGIDNLVFIAIITNKLPVSQQKRARLVGLSLACITRLLLLAVAVEITRSIHPLFSCFGQAFSGRDLFLIGGGLFLLAKGTREIHTEAYPSTTNTQSATSLGFWFVAIEIMFLDIIFSLDSVITAVGLAQNFNIMAAAIIIVVLLMLLASEPLNHFIQTYPTLRMLALSFLLLVGVALIADGLGFHIPRGYLYFAISFSLFVEMLNILTGRRPPKSS